MADQMSRSEVLKWLDAHGGQKSGKDGYRVDYVTVRNPDYSATNPAKSDLPQTIQVRKVTWTAADGQTLTVVDSVPERAAPDLPNTTADYQAPQYRGPYSPEATDPVYDNPEFNVKDPNAAPATAPDRTPQATAFNEATAARQQSEAQTNFDNYGIWETNAQRRERELKEKNEADQDYERSRRATIDERSAGIQADQNAIARERLEEDRRQAQNRENQPQFLSRADPESKNIAVFDPRTGSIVTTPNPNYDRAKVEAQQKKDELTLAIQLRKMSADEATAEYTRWYKSNIELPFMQAQEARARAQENRAALEAEERRRQFAADFGLRKSQFGEQAGQNAVGNELALLPYRAGPQEAEQMSAAINSLAKGGSLANDASAGINFTADAFQFNRPDFEGIAKKATARALKGLTNYRPAEGSFATADYGGINTMPDMSTAPSTTPTGGPDLQQLYNQLVGSYAVEE
jgi:hypothetical protein